MYSTCLFCHSDLGANTEIEHFPVGRRLAYDPARGRLWVVCRQCERWNLTPLDERWEAVEECERRFRGTKLRVSTENIGLARVGEALELVRIGNPRLPEFAAWRYGDQFGRRRRTRMWQVGLQLGAFGAAFGGLLFAGFEVGIGLGTGWFYIYRAAASKTKKIIEGDPNAIVARVPVADGGALTVERRHLSGVVVRPEASDSGWALEVMHRGGITRLPGDDALRAARIVLPAINRFGATREQVSAAVQLIDRADSVASVFAKIGRASSRQLLTSAHVAGLDPTLRVALEMAAHDEVERRAMEGELASLEREWRDAEEIAGIADDLLVPRAATDFIARLKSRGEK
ncbi:MAG: hypothetical protein ABJD07_08810 [Gemmatimonadaceae bacterium]